MARISSLMHLGQQSMANSQTALQTTSHNIANANTEGYTRQRVDMTTAEPVTLGNHRLGQGVKTADVTRVTNSYLNKQIQEETNKLGAANGKQSSLMRVEQIFNESINKGLNHFMANFFNSFQEMANNPESQATRALVKENSKILADDFHRIKGQLNSIQKDIDVQLHAHVSEINGMASEIASLNDKIHQVEVMGAKANDERDRRDLLVKKMGELVNIRYTEGDGGKVIITVGNTGVLVSGADHSELFTEGTPAREGKREGNFEIMYKHGDRGIVHQLTDELKGGTIGGLLEVRDKTINELHGNMDHMAYTIHEAVNTIHEAGFDRYNQTGRSFFNPVEEEFDAAANIQVNEEILSDPGKISGALKANSPGDNRVANAIAGLQARPLFKDGTASVDDYFNGLVGEFAVLTSKNNMLQEHQKNIVSQLNAVRESVSGVSLDEEVTDMVKFQKAFDASARLVKTADEMFDTVLNLKRL